YREAIDMRIRIFGDIAHADIAWSKNNLGLVKQTQGKLDEAETLFTEALKMRREVLPETHYHISQSLGNLGSLHFYRQEYNESAAIFEEVLNMQREALGKDHPNLAMYLNNLATVLTQALKPEEAINYYREALGIQDKHFKSTHSNTMRMRDNFADAYEDLNDFEESEKLRLTNLEAIKKEKGIEDPQAQEVLKNLITLYEKWNKNQEKQEYEKMLVKSD
ncbi:MAG: tetratricopeptide repeat protein, partial [Candidatus Halalkalibacterium sp. M3_1C_030]